MRIVHVLHDFLPRHRAGAELYVLHLGRAQAAAGHEVSVLCADYDPARPHGSVVRREHGGLAVHEVTNAWDFDTFEETWRSPLMAERAREVLTAVRPDVVHVHNLLTLTLELPAIAADLGIPVVATLHDHALVCPSGGTRVHVAECHVCDVVDPARCARCIPDAPLHRQRALRGVARRAGRALPLVAAGRRRAPRLVALAERAAARLAAPGGGPTEADVRLRLDGARRASERVSRFVAPSRALRDALVAQGVVPADRVTVAQYGLPSLGVVRELAQDGRVRVGYVGTLAWHKGVHLLVEAAARLPADRVVLRIHGSEQVAPEYVADLRRRAGALDLRLEGPFREEERGRIYGGLDLLVVPSVWPEVFGLVVQEARLAGLPVIASRTGGLPELVRDGEDGLLVAPGSVDALADALRRLVLDPALRGRLGGAPQRVRSLTDDAAGWERTYAEVVAEGPRPATAPQGRIVAVLVCYRAPARCAAAVRALASSSRRVDAVVVVDNGGADVLALRAALPEATVLATAENLGFAGGANVGLRAALASGADAVLLLNDDASLAPDALLRLEAALAAPGVGLVGPAVVSARDRDTVESLGLSFRPSTGRMRELGHGASHAAVGGQAPRVVPGLTGCALLVRREVLEQVGPLDERFFFYFEDLELCLRAGRAGWRAVIVPAAVAYHEGSATIGRRSARRLYHAVRGHLRLGASLGGAGAPLRQALIAGRNVAHALLRRRDFEPGALREVLRGVVDHLRGTPHRG